jgi:hypothetical protein
LPRAGVAPADAQSHRPEAALQCFAVPLLPIIIILLLPFVVALAVPFSLVQRYRLGTARRRARGWVAAINFLLMLVSCAVFLGSTALTNFWVPHAFSYSLRGLLVGALVGLLGLGLTKWEAAPRVLHYTPNRLLVLLLTLAVSVRILYGLVRMWEAWGARHETPWLAASGIAGSLGVGAAVLGYYLVYSAGVTLRLRTTLAA